MQNITAVRRNLYNAVVKFRPVRPRNLEPQQYHDRCSARSLTLNRAYKLTKGAGLIWFSGLL